MVTFEEAKAYCERASRISYRISRKLEEIGSLETVLTSTTQHIKTDNVLSSGNQNKFTDMMAVICDLKTECEQMALEKCEIIRNIEQIDNEKVFKVMYYKYVNGLRPEEICDKAEISIRQMYKLIREGIEKMQNILDIQ